MRLSLAEYGDGLPLDRLPLGSPALLERANAVIRRALGIRRDALVISGGRLRALGIAGLLRLSKDMELEIVPKMLQSGDGWRESLFLLSALSRYGGILSGEHIHAGTAHRNSLYDIAGRILAGEYAKCRRRPIRQYRQERFFDFAVDGEPDFETAFARHPEGVAQTRVSFDRLNPYNAVIRSAMGTVLPHVTDPSTRQILLRAIQELGRQLPPPRTGPRLPARSREWAEIYRLSSDILSGMGGSLDDGGILSPGFIVDTWRIWEWLVTLALDVGLGVGFRTVPQAAVPWGTRRACGSAYLITVFPDAAVFRQGDASAPLFLADAKYKALPEGGAVEVERSDLYEAFAFCHAAGVKRLFLVYPAASGEGRGAGSVSQAADYVIGDVTISAVTAALGAMGKQGDLTSLCRSIGGGILALL